MCILLLDKINAVHCGQLAKVAICGSNIQPGQWGHCVMYCSAWKQELLYQGDPVVLCQVGVHREIFSWAGNFLPVHIIWE